MAIPRAGDKIIHIKSDSYLIEFADNVSIVGTTSSDGSSKINLVFTRDVVDVSHEELAPIEGMPDALQLTLPDAALKNLRMQLANLQLSHEAAKRMHAALGSTLSQLEIPVEKPE